MWCLKNSGIIFICMFCIACDSVASGYCEYDFENYNLTMNQTMLGPRPGEISAEYSSLTAVLKVHVLERRESFNLTLLGIPYRKHISECPVTPISVRENLRQYSKTCTVYQKAKKRIPRSFAIMFTGCYYFIMTNEKGSTWQWGPKFYETNNTYLDTALKLSLRPKFKPEQNSSIELIALLKVPLNCVKVIAQVFQFEKEIEATDDIEKSRIPASQECWFMKEEKNLTTSCGVSNLTTSLVLDVRVKEATEQDWTAVITWKKLRHGGGMYYLRFVPNTISCEEKYTESELHSWNPVNISVLMPLDPHFPPPDPEPIDTDQNSNIIIGVCISLIMTLIVILVFWWWKCPRFPGNPTAVSENFVKLEENFSIKNGIESDNILLLYVSGSPTFMNLMSNFRDRLAQACHCHVYDLYADRDWDKIKELGVKQFIKEPLQNGCKVVWIDTPEFRSRCNKQAEQYIQASFRDEGILYALQLITDSHLDCATQYLYHFVVRIKGLQVQDRYGDPLLAVVPHKRYFFPEHLRLLYKELTDSMKRLKNPKCEA